MKLSSRILIAMGVALVLGGACLLRPVDELGEVRKLRPEESVISGTVAIYPGCGVMDDRSLGNSIWRRLQFSQDPVTVRKLIPGIWERQANLTGFGETHIQLPLGHMAAFVEFAKPVGEVTCELW